MAMLRTKQTPGQPAREPRGIQVLRIVRTGELERVYQCRLLEPVCRESLAPGLPVHQRLTGHRGGTDGTGTNRQGTR
jgi:hypothetical protein